MPADTRPDLTVLDGVGEKPCAPMHDVRTWKMLPGVYTRACLNAVIKLTVARHRHVKGEHTHPPHAPPLEQHSRLLVSVMEMVWLFTIHTCLRPGCQPYCQHPFLSPFGPLVRCSYAAIAAGMVGFFTVQFSPGL